MSPLFEALRLIHDHGAEVFHERLFRALQPLFGESRYALELFGRDGSYTNETNVPMHEIGGEQVYPRLIELLEKQSPTYAALVAGETEAMRLTDLISSRQLRRTDLYQEIFRPLYIHYQIGIPIQSKYTLGGLTINRDAMDFTNEEVAIARILAPHIATAFENDCLITSLSSQQKSLAGIDFALLRKMGLTRREAEVMTWIAQAKRDCEIAIILGISVRTVNQHVRSILTKLGVENRTAATNLVMHRGFGEASNFMLSSSKPPKHIISR